MYKSVETVPASLQRPGSIATSRIKLTPDEGKVDSL